MIDVDLTPAELGAICLGLAACAGLLSALRLALARRSRPSIQLQDGGSTGRAITPLPLRARVLGALLVGNIILNVATTLFGTLALQQSLDDAGPFVAIPAISALIIGVEALARLCVHRGLVLGRFWPLGDRLDRYAEKLTASEEIRGQVDLLHRKGDVVKAERDMLGGLLDLKDLTVEEVMVHRTRMRTVDADLSIAEIRSEVLASPYTRMPLWRDRPENIVGMLHAKDLLRAIEADGGGAGIDIATVATAPWFVPATMSVRDQLSAFLAQRKHVALVVDEYGDLLGLVTLEDIIEEIVGEISDEHDVAARGVRQQGDGSLLVDGSVPIRDLNRMMDWSLPDEEATTVAGLVIHEAQTIPESGQVFTFHGFRFEVLRRLRNRVTALRISPVERPAAPEPHEEASA